MSKGMTSFLRLDVHKDSTVIAEAEAGRETPRFVGTVGPELGQLIERHGFKPPAQRRREHYAENKKWAE